MAANPELSIIIPAYNESGRIAPSLASLRDYLADHPEWRGVEVIVVCDGCGDDTESVVRSCAVPGLRVIAYERNRGKGYAVKTGILASRGRTVVFADADGATPFAEISHLAPLLAEGYDVVIGSRQARGARITGRQPWRRRVLGRLFSLATRAVLGLEFADTQCGFKMFRGDAARALFRHVECPGFGFDLEVLVLARSGGLQVVEAGVEWQDQGQSTVSPWRDGLRMLGTLYSLRQRRKRHAMPIAVKEPVVSTR
jgi:dolichyl-phosphate beta-glucosyltransferase